MFTVIYEHYPRDIYPRVKKGWGTYAERMVRRRDITGEILLDREGQPVNPLKSLIGKLKRRVAASSFRNARSGAWL